MSDFPAARLSYSALSTRMRTFFVGITATRYSKRYAQLSEKFAFLADQSQALNQRMAGAQADNEALKRERSQLENENSTLRKSLASLEDRAIVKERRVLVRVDRGRRAYMGINIGDRQLPSLTVSP